jgi:transcriptional regulator with XRE-family HTH domain
MPNKTVGKQIAFYRHITHVKQEDLAKQVGITQSILSDIENDKVSPTVSLLQMFAKVLQVPASALLPESESMIVNSHIQDSAVNHSSITNQSNMEHEKRLLHELLAAKDAVIASKENENRLLREQNKELLSRLSTKVRTKPNRRS